MSRPPRGNIRIAGDGCQSGGCSTYQHVDCVILVITYNNAKHIGRLLDSLPAATGGLSTRCLVLDNGSLDGTMRIVRARTDAIPVETGANLGYSGAIITGRAIAGPCTSLLILNPDLILEPGAVTRLYEELGRTLAGMTVPMVLRADGSVYPSLRREPTLWRALGDALFGAHWGSRPEWLGTTVFDSTSYCQPRDAEWASGAAMLLSRSCSDAVGEWDQTRFFLYSEETDFAARARRAGYRIRYVPAARVHHEEGGSGQSPALRALLAVNSVRYYEKYHRRPATSVFRALVALRYLLRSAGGSQVNRAVLRTLISRRRWGDLPGAEARSPGQENSSGGLRRRS